MRRGAGRVLGRLLARSRGDGATGERGFTLIEVVASVVILGIIAAPLGMAMVLGFRTVFSQQQNLARTSDIQQLSSYFPSDVQSVDAQGVNPTDSNNKNICREDSSTQTSLITFVWDEDLGVSGQSMARYIAEGSGSDSKIVRRFCRGAADPSQPASATNDWTDITVASHFGTDTGAKDAADYTITTDPHAPDPGKFTPQCTNKSCFIELHGAYDYRLDADRRVPGQAPGALAPDAPTNVHGTPGNQRATLWWADGASNGSDVNLYTIEVASAGSDSFITSTTPGIGTAGLQINSLSNNVAYKFRVNAKNDVGTSPYSAWSDPVVPGPTTPDPPTIGTATASPTVNGSAGVSWSLPAGYNNGGSNLVGYRVYALDSPNAPLTSDVNDPAATSGTVTGLLDNTQYLLQVTARNAYGEGSPSAASSAVVTLPGKPGTPNVQSNGTAGAVVLTFNPPSAGDFTNFTNFRAQVTGRAGAETAVPVATACPNGAGGTCSLTVTGLGTSGQTYSIAVQAQNATGWGPLSDPATGIELTPPTIGSATIAPVGAPGGGYVGPGVTYNVYANATDASGVATVNANVNSVTAGQTAVAMTNAGGPWTVGATSYAYRSSSMLTADSSLTSGSKSYSITAIDTFANSATTSFNVTADTTAPTVTITKVSGTTQSFPYNTNAASLISVGGACGTSSSPPDVATVNIAVTGPSGSSGTATCTAGAWTYTFSPSVATQGNYTFTATQSDYAGNTGTSGTKAVNLDRTAPTISASIAAATSDTTQGGFVKPSGTYYVYANVSDPISGVNTVNANLSNVTTSGATNVALTAGSYTVGAATYNYRSASLTASAVAAGTKSYTVTAVDNATNSSGAQPFSVVVDGTPPTISGSVVASTTDTTSGGYVRTNGSYYVYSNVSDPTAGVATVTANVSSLTSGATATTLSTAGGPWTIGATSYAYRSASQTVSGSVTAGTKTFTVTATDWAANSVTSGTVNVTVDNTAPAVSITKVNGTTRTFPYFTNQNVTTVGGTCTTSASDSTTVNVSITGADTDSGTATCVSGAWTYTLSSAWSAEGASTIAATQTDFAGNTGTATNQTVTIDKTIPVVTLTTPADGLVTKDTTPPLGGACTNGQGNVAVTITGPTNTSLSSISCSGSAWSATSPTLTSGAGYSAVATQTDAAGNVGTSSANSFTVDAVAPTVSSVIASSNDTTTGGYVRQGGGYYVYANASDALSGITSVNAGVTNVTTGQSSVALSTAGGPWTVGATSYAYRSAALTANASLSSGSKSYSVTATDGATNTTTINPTVTVDNAPPSPTVTSVNGSARTFPYSTNQTVTTVGGACGNAAGDQTPITVTITGASTASGTATCSGTAWTYTLSTPWSTEGVTNVTAAQSDAAGGTGTSPTQTITIDKTAPVIGGSTIAMTTDTTTGGVIKPSGSYYVYANVTDSGTGISSVTANVANVTTGATSVTLSSGSYAVGATSYNYRSAAQTASAITAGVKSYTITGTDVAGNVAGPQSFNVTVDSTGPTLASVIAPVGATTGGFIAQGSNYYVYANATDPAGVASVTANVAVASNVLTTGQTAAPLTTTGGPWTIGGTAYAYRSASLAANSSIATGSKNYSVTGTDTATNTTTTTFTVTIKNTGPAPTVTSVNGSARTFPYATNVNVTTVGGACGTAPGDVSSMIVSIAGTDTETGGATCSSGTWSYTLSSAWSTQGTSTVTASQPDLAGNTGVSTAQTIIVDKTAPVVSGSAIATTTDTTSGGVVKQGGSYYVYAQVTDSGAGMGSVTANVANVTTGATSVTLTSGSYIVGATSYNYRSAAQTATTPLSAGSKSYTVTGIDLATNSSGAQPFSVVVDNTAPSVSTAAIAAQGATTAGYIGSNNQYYVYANVSDTSALSSVNASVTNVTTGASSVPLFAGSYSVGATTYNYRSASQIASSGLTAGSKSFTVTAIDVAANSSGATSWNVTVDNTAPAVAITKVNAASPSFPYSLNSTVTTIGGTCTTSASDSSTIAVTLTGTASESGNATCTSGAWTYTLATPWTADGTTTAFATQTDFAGNVGAATSRSITVDKTPPVISATVMASTTDTVVGGYIKPNGTYYVYANVNDALSSVSTVTANVSSITSGQTAVSMTSGSYTVGGVSYNRRTASLTAGSSLTSGTKTYTVTAVDALGNTTTSPTQNVTVDTTTPAPTGITLANGGTLGTLDVGDSITVTYNGPINPDTICSGLASGNDVTGVDIDLTGHGSSADTLSAPDAPCAAFASSINLGGSYYSTSSTRTLTTTFSWDGSANAVTVTVTNLSSTSSRSSNVPAGKPAYTPTASILDPAGNAMGTSTFTSTASSRF